MGYFFVDESIHDKRGGFILAALVFTSHDPTVAVDGALRDAGFLPGVDEFKSSSKMRGDARRESLRRNMKELLRDVRIGLVVTPASERPRLGNHVLRGLEKIIHANRLSATKHQIYLDQDMPFQDERASMVAFTSSVASEVHTGQDSVGVRGIQLADLAAHTMSIMLLEQLGEISKKIEVDQESGYAARADIQIGFEMWSTLRTQFFTLDAVRPPNAPPSHFVSAWRRTERFRARLRTIALMRRLEEIVSARVPRDLTLYEQLNLRVGEYALHVADECSPQLREAAHARFDTSYVGCIH